MEKLNPDGECLGVSIQYLLDQFGFSGFPISTLKKAKTTVDALEIFNLHKLNYYIYLPALSYFYPGTWLFLFKFYDRVIFSKTYFSTKKNLQKSKKRYFVLYHLTARQLYNLNDEFWTHYVVGYCNEDKVFTIYDPLKNIIESEIKSKINDINEQFLDNLSTYKIIIF